MKMQKLSILSGDIQLTSDEIRIWHQVAYLLLIFKLHCLMEEVSISFADCDIRNLFLNPAIHLAPFYGDVH